MNRNSWLRRLNEFKEAEEPEAVLLVAGNPELIRIVVAWTQTKVARATRPTRPAGNSDEERWTWLWDNVHFDQEKLLARIPNGSKKTQANLEALIASRVLYPDGTANRYVDRYVKERVLTLFSRSLQEAVKRPA